MKVKICGIRDMAAAEAVAQGADYMGFIMDNRFRRYAAPEVVREICSRIKGCTKVGVFVDQSAEKINQLMELCQLDMAQLHGHEAPELAESVRYPVIKAFRYGEDFSSAAANSYPAEFILIDSYSKNTVGGSGISFAWQKAAQEIKKIHKPFFIAGGIKESTIQEAKNIFQPYGIDASGALEKDGQKSPELIKSFLAAAEKYR